MTETSRKPLVLTQGDPAGIGPDIAIAAWLLRREKGLPPFAFIGDPEVLRVRARQMDVEIALKESDCQTAAADFAEYLPVLPIETGYEVVAGEPHVAGARSTIGAIERAVELVMTGHAAAVVTNPIAKAVLYEAKFAFPGHTEFLAALAARDGAARLKPVMMIAGPKLRTIPVTVHIPLKDVAAALSPELIFQTCRIAHEDLKHRFGMARPRLAVAGLNPHAGEGGAIGREDEEIIHPAVQMLRAAGIDAFGPLSADTMFHDEARKRYDVAVCMYHDQALIPSKALGFDHSVNITLGLPFVRTSPDHGTAFGIAGQGIAKPDSLIAALKLADEISHGAQAD